jgi:hypothetical protein
MNLKLVRADRSKAHKLQSDSTTKCDHAGDGDAVPSKYECAIRQKTLS